VPNPTSPLSGQTGCTPRVDHRSYADRGLEIEDRSYDAAQRRNGWIAEQLEVIERNAERIITDPKVALAVLTEHQATFSRRDLARFVNRHTRDAAQFALVLARVEGASDLVRLGRDIKGEERFSSREMVAAERRLKEHATILAMAKRHRLGASVRRDATAIPEIGKEQKEALAYLLADEGLALLVGFAGSGKSRLLAVAREAWERTGYQVRGAALAGVAAEGLEAGSGITSRTLASWEHAGKQNRELLAKGEVLVVDEAGLVGSRQLERVLATARAARAKVVLVGDPEQLRAIEAGAAFRSLLERHRPASLSQVRRQRSVWTQAATRDLATGRTAEALRRYAGAGMVHANATRELAQEKLVAQWEFDRTERPERAQLMLVVRCRQKVPLCRMLPTLAGCQCEPGRGYELSASHH
jgi:Ti-type conjugative transfer relaxase TraA